MLKYLDPTPRAPPSEQNRRDVAAFRLANSRPGIALSGLRVKCQMFRRDPIPRLATCGRGRILCPRYMNHSIPWHLMPEDDIIFLDQAKIERGAASITFHRELSRDELASACFRLCNFRPFVPDAAQSCISFAIGDAFNQFSKRFGKRDGAYFIKQFVRASTLREATLKIAGSTLIYLQVVEHLIKGCCAMLNLKGLNLRVEDLQSGDSRRRRKTLGQLKAALIGTSAFSIEFEASFNRFVSERNEFIHTFWIAELVLDKRTGLPTEHHLRKELEFTMSLMRQAREIELVFRGLYGAIGESLSKGVENHEALAPWKRYIGKFRATLRSHGPASGPPG